MCERRLSETAATKAIDNAAVERAGGGFAAFEQNRPPAPRTHPPPFHLKKCQEVKGLFTLTYRYSLCTQKKQRRLIMKKYVFALFALIVFSASAVLYAAPSFSVKGAVKDSSFWARQKRMPRVYIL